MDHATGKLGTESNCQHTHRRDSHACLFYARGFQAPQKLIILRSGSDTDFVLRSILDPQAQQKALRLSTLSTLRVGRQCEYSRLLCRSVRFGPAKQAHGVTHGKKWTAYS